MAGDPSAPAELERLCGQGLGFLLKRQCGPGVTDEHVRQFLAGIAAAMTKGEARCAGDVIRLLREEVERLTAQGLTRSSEPTESDVRRILLSLKGFSAREREMLLRYYSEGQSVARIVREMKIKEEEFLLVKARLKTGVAPFGELGTNSALPARVKVAVATAGRS